jgi:hypothetical protein
LYVFIWYLFLYSFAAAKTIAQNKSVNKVGGETDIPVSLAHCGRSCAGTTIGKKKR